MNETQQNPDQEADVPALAQEMLSARGDMLRIRTGYQFDNG